ncbi:hypothetical protein [Flavobacterium mesophilum]|uniref:hypothetical protein n=1 Tax=Flavobacterium mesophilum TaxID=3143495 RepID=UPI0031DA17D4
MSKNWEEIKWIFDVDGSLRDIYIKNTTLEDWKILIHFLNSNHIIKYDTLGENKIINSIDLEYSIQYLLDETAQLETKIASIIIDDIIINQHFFSIEEIEFDIDPKEINSFKDYEKIVNFMEQISQLLRKPVILTGENQREFPLIEADFPQKKLKTLTKVEAMKLWK